MRGFSQHPAWDLAHGGSWAMLTSSSMTDSEGRRELEGRQACLPGPMAACTLHSIRGTPPAPPRTSSRLLYSVQSRFHFLPYSQGPTLAFWDQKMGAFVSSRNHFRFSFSPFKGLGGLSPASEGGREQTRSRWLWRGWCLLFMRLL